jgi:hypothetical protein
VTVFPSPKKLVAKSRSPTLLFFLLQLIFQTKNKIGVAAAVMYVYYGCLGCDPFVQTADNKKSN